VGQHHVGGYDHGEKGEEVQGALEGVG